MGEKYLQFNTEKALKNKLNFIEFLPRLTHFLTKEEKIEYAILLNRLRKDQDPEIIRKLEHTDFSEDERVRNEILNRSK
jgi:hypothetical protein